MTGVSPPLHLGGRSHGQKRIVARKSLDDDILGAYTSTLGKLGGAQRELNAMVLPEGVAGTALERTAFAHRRLVLEGTGNSQLFKLKTILGEANATMRKDLDIEAIDWSAYENSINSKLM